MADSGFYGEFKHGLDAKGRIIMPAQFRELLGDTFRVSQGLDHCLYVYTDEEWGKLEQKLSQIPDISNPDARRLKRFFFSGSAVCEVDKQGRFLLPSNLRSFARLNRDVVLAGTGNRIEIWNQEDWERINGFDDLDELAASMEKYGL